MDFIDSKIHPVHALGPQGSLPSCFLTLGPQWLLVTAQESETWGDPWGLDA